MHHLRQTHHHYRAGRIFAANAPFRCANSLFTCEEQWIAFNPGANLDSASSSAINPCEGRAQHLRTSASLSNCAHDKKEASICHRSSKQLFSKEAKSGPRLQQSLVRIDHACFSASQSTTGIALLFKFGAISSPHLRHYMCF
jgi:hypothetical protein